MSDAQRVLVDFAKWDSFRQNVLDYDLLQQPSADLDQSLATPFLFMIGETYLIPPDFWLPLLGMGRWATHEVQLLQEINFVEVSLGETGKHVLMSRHGDMVTVWSSCQTPTPRADVDYASLLAAWKDCSARIREYLRTELPELAENPDFAPWFRGEEDWWVDFHYQR